MDRCRGGEGTDRVEKADRNTGISRRVVGWREGDRIRRGWRIFID